jgi:mono/diheme cytochrome c family protein
MRHRHASWSVVVITMIAIAAVQVGCGGDDEEGTTEATTETTPTETTEAGGGAGEKLFVSGCGECHTLEAAGTTGTIGPDLDELAPHQKEEVLDVMAEGPGGMPPDIYTGQQAEQVAEYVSDVAGSGP